jgi:hypothetical protein
MRSRPRRSMPSFVSTATTVQWMSLRNRRRENAPAAAGVEDRQFARAEALDRLGDELEAKAPRRLGLACPASGERARSAHNSEEPRHPAIVRLPR